MKTALLAVIVAGAVMTAPEAQQAAGAGASVVAGDMGGGALLPGDREGSGNMLIALRVTPDSRVRIKVSMQVSCPGREDNYVNAAVSPVAIVAPDGTFRATGTRVEHLGENEFRTGYDIAGSVTASGATGTTTVTLQESDPTFPTCGSASVVSAPVAWQARRATARSAPGAVAGGLLYGSFSHRRSGLRGAIILRVSRDGKTLERVVHHSGLRCTRRVSTPNLTLEEDFDYVERQAPIRVRSGSFSQQLRVSLPFGAVISRLSERFAGTLGTLGARGTYRHDGRIVTRTTGRVRERCTTLGTIRWTAAR